MSTREFKITVLYNNIGHDPRLRPAHGFSCLIEGSGEPILFDSGGDARILIENMQALGIAPNIIKKVVLSHPHWDHSGGLFAFSHELDDAEVFLPTSTSKNFGPHLETLGVKVTVVDKLREIAEGILSTGTMGIPQMREKREQSLVLNAKDGSVVLTGCAHPGITAIVDKAVELCGPRVHTVLGGLHLVDASRLKIENVIKYLQHRKVRKLGASHCTGKTAMAVMAARWGDEFIQFGCGESFVC